MAAPTHPRGTTGSRKATGRGPVPLRIALAVASLAVTVAVGLSCTAGAATVRASDPPLQSTVLTAPLPGFVAAPVGPTNGPLTATEFASQSSDPEQAETQFAALASQPGFGSFIRLWTDRDGSGSGANDLAVLLFRIPDTAQAAAFTSGLRVPFQGSRATIPFVVPSVPGAQGFSIKVTTPVDATEQVVVFRAGHYVSMIQLASVTSPTNTTPLTTSQAITVSYEQYQLLAQADPAGAHPKATAPPARAPVHSATTAPGVASTSPRSGGAPLVTLLVMIALVVFAAGAALVVYRRRHRDDAVPAPTTDPWGPDGVFASFGAFDTRPLDDHPGGPDEVGRRGPTGQHPVQTVPSLVPSAPLESAGRPARHSEPARA